MIAMDKEYRYRDGGKAKILSVTAFAPYSVVSQNESGNILRHTASGNFYHDRSESDKDMIEVVPLWRGELWVHADGRSTSGSMANYSGWRRIEAVEVRKDAPKCCWRGMAGDEGCTLPRGHDGPHEFADGMIAAGKEGA